MTRSRSPQFATGPPYFAGGEIAKRPARLRPRNHRREIMQLNPPRLPMRDPVRREGWFSGSRRRLSRRFKIDTPEVPVPSAPRRPSEVRAFRTHRVQLYRATWTARFTDKTVVECYRILLNFYRHTLALSLFPGRTCSSAIRDFRRGTSALAVDEKRYETTLDHSKLNWCLFEGTLRLGVKVQVFGIERNLRSLTNIPSDVENSIFLN